MTITTMTTNSIRCRAPINIAVIKYWGKRDVTLNLPTNSSLSLTIDREFMETVTVLNAVPEYERDVIILNGEEIPLNEKYKAVLEKARSMARQRPGLPVIKVKSDSPLPEPADPNHFIRIVSDNNFPTAAGLASSASGFACLVFALAMLFHLDTVWTMSEISALARIGSGSACRSLFPGFVEWEMGTRSDGSDSVAKPLNCIGFPGLQVLIIVLQDKVKKVSSTSGMKVTAATSKLFSHRVTEIVPKRMDEIKRSLEAGDFETFSRITMQDSNQFHAVCLDAYPPIHYLNDSSYGVIDRVHEAIEKHGIKVAYTFDAGPNAVLFFPDLVHLERFLAVSRITCLDDCNVKTNSSAIRHQLDEIRKDLTTSSDKQSQAILASLIIHTKGANATDSACTIG